MKLRSSSLCLFAALALVAALALARAKAAAPTPLHIVLRHDLQGEALQTLANLTARFNARQKDGARLLLEDRGAPGAPRRLPQLALVDADDSLDFFGTLPRFKPLHQAMTEAGSALDAKRFLAPIVAAVDDPAGRVQALPLGLGLPVLFWNKDAFRHAGLDPERPPATWRQLQDIASKLYDAGNACPITSSRFAWVHLENLSAQHGEPIAARDQRGIMRVVLNRMVDVKHVSLLASWQKSRYFHYYGRADEADRKFVAGDCAVLSGASSLGATTQRPRFALGVAALPHHDDVYGATPQRLLPDGAALWLLAGNSRAEDRLAARFVAFLLEPEVQRAWVAGTGYLPMSEAALGAAPAPTAAALRALLTAAPASARGKHGYGLGRERTILAEEIETLWRGDRAPMEALNAAVRRINQP